MNYTASETDMECECHLSKEEKHQNQKMRVGVGVIPPKFFLNLAKLHDFGEVGSLVRLYVHVYKQLHQKAETLSFKIVHGLLCLSLEEFEIYNNKNRQKCLLPGVDLVKSGQPGKY